jgi:pimeloyl-ACP methyl ester carboxylesterase
MADLICIHSSGSGARQWKALAAAAASDHAMVAPELIGYGGHDAWRPGDPVTLDDEAARIAPLVGSARSRAVVVGHSYGGAVALRVALRCRDHVAGLVLYEPSVFSVIARGADEDGARREIVATAGAIRDDMYAGRAEEAARRFVDYWSGEGAWDALEARRQQAILARMPKVVKEFGALFDDALPPAAYARLPFPVLWLEGAATVGPPRAVARRLLPVFSDVRFKRVPGAGHMGPITHTDTVNAEILRFVRALADDSRLGLAA